MADDLSFMEGYVPPQKGEKGAQPPAPATQQSQADQPDFMSGYVKPGQKADADTAPTVGTGEDVARSVLAKGVRGAVALPGIFGDVPQMLGAEKYRPPTTEEYIEKISSISPKVREMLAYKPQTAPGRYAGSVAEFLPSALIPGGGGLATRALSAAGAGLGSQGVEDFIKEGKIPIEGTPYEAGAKLAGAVVGGGALPAAARGIGSLFQGAQTRAAKDVASALSTDFARGPAAGTPADIARSEIPMGAVGGQATADLLKKAAGKASDDAINLYNTSLGTFKENVIPKVQGGLERLFGGDPIDFASSKKALTSRINQTNETNYKNVMGLPHAQSINDPALDQIANTVPQRIVDEVTQGIQYRGKDPASYGFSAVTDKAGNITGYKLPAQGMSLRGWDEIKQGLDSEIGKMYDPITKGVKPGYDPSDLNAFKGRLIDVLDHAVPEYQPIRFEGSQLYDSRNAMDAGYKYFNDGNFRKIGEKEDLVRRLTDSQKQDFAYGYAAAFQDAIAKDPMKAIGAFNKGQGDFNFNKMKFALGEDNAHQLIGDIHSGYLGSTLKGLQGGSPDQFGTAKAFLGGGTLGAIGSEMLGLGETIATGSAMSLAPGAIAGAILSTVGRGIYTARERAKADEILRLMVDPNSRAKLGKMIAEDPDARSFLQKLYTSMARNAPAVAAQTNQAASPQQANGGRIARRAGGRVGSEGKADALIRAAEMAKKNINKTTEPLLDQPDETITRALAVAKTHI